MPGGLACQLCRADCSCRTARADPEAFPPPSQSRHAFASQPLHLSVAQQLAAAHADPVLLTPNSYKLAWRPCTLAPQSGLLLQYCSQPEESEGSPGQHQQHNRSEDCGQNDGQQHGHPVAWHCENTTGQCLIGGAELERGSGLACASLQAGGSIWRWRWIALPANCTKASRAVAMMHLAGCCVVAVKGESAVNGMCCDCIEANVQVAG